MTSQSLRQKCQTRLDLRLNPASLLTIPAQRWPHHAGLLYKTLNSHEKVQSVQVNGRLVATSSTLDETSGLKEHCQQQEDAKDIYEEVSEDKYKRIVRDRLQQDDFVEDDGVGGYEDNGMDDFGERQEESEEEQRPQSELLVTA